MAMDFAKPATSDNYSTAFVPNIVGNFVALGQMLDSSFTTITGTPPQYTKRINRTSGLFEEYNGGWGELAMGYAKKSGDIFTGPVYFTSGSEPARIQHDTGFLSGYNTAGTVRTGYIQFNTAAAVKIAAEGGANITFTVGGSDRGNFDTSGNFNAYGQITATSANSVINSNGSAGYGAFYARGSGVNTGYVFFGNVTNGEQARIQGQDGGVLTFNTGSGAIERLRLDGTNLSTTLNGSFGATLNTGSGVSTQDCTIEVGGNRTGSGNSFMDFHSTASTDFEARIIRASGANGVFQIVQIGTGNMEFQTGGSTRLAVTSGGVVQDGGGKELGFKGLPSASVTTGAFVAADRGKCVYATGGVTVPTGLMAAEDVVTIFNNTASTITITSALTTLYQAGTTNLGNRSLAARGIATVIFLSGSTGVISGAGLS